VCGHGVPEELVDRAFTASRALFALPQAEKLRLIADSNNRGWTPFKEVLWDLGLLG
jgi:isopenicillin N synthase-like dioxygenase